MDNIFEDIKFWARLVIVLKNYKLIKTQKDFLKFTGCKRKSDPPFKEVLGFLKDNDICEIDKERMPYIYKIDDKKLFKILKAFKYQSYLVETMVEPGVYR